MKPLPEQLKHSGYNLTLVERHGDLAIYSKRKPGHHNDHFEAIQIHRLEEMSIMGKIIEAHESYPSSEEWGTFAFTYPTLERAQSKLQEWQNRPPTSF